MASGDGVAYDKLSLLVESLTALSDGIVHVSPR